MLNLSETKQRMQQCIDLMQDGVLYTKDKLTKIHFVSWHSNLDAWYKRGEISEISAFMQYANEAWRKIHEKNT